MEYERVFYNLIELEMNSPLLDRADCIDIDVYVDTEDNLLFSYEPLSTGASRVPFGRYDGDVLGHTLIFKSARGKWSRKVHITEFLIEQLSWVTSVIYQREYFPYADIDEVCREICINLINGRCVRPLDAEEIRSSVNQEAVMASINKPISIYQIECALNALFWLGYDAAVEGIRSLKKARPYRNAINQEKVNALIDKLCIELNIDDDKI